MQYLEGEVDDQSKIIYPRPLGNRNLQNRREKFNFSSLNFFLLSSLFLTSTAALFFSIRTSYCTGKVDSLINNAGNTLIKLEGFFDSNHFFAEKLLNTRVNSYFDIEVLKTPVKVKLNSTIAGLLGEEGTAMIYNFSDELILNLIDLTKDVSDVVNSSYLIFFCDITSFNLAIGFTVTGFAFGGIICNLYKIIRQCRAPSAEEVSPRR